MQTRPTRVPSRQQTVLSRGRIGKGHMHRWLQLTLWLLLLPFPAAPASQQLLPPPVAQPAAGPVVQ
jgi:hypothetical protein